MGDYAGSSALKQRTIGNSTNLLLARLSGARTVSRSRSLSRRQSEHAHCVGQKNAAPRKTAERYGCS
jgi:hypothetical protein